MSKQEDFKLSSKVQWGIMIVGFIIMAASIAVGSINRSGATADLATLQDEVSSLSNNLALKRQEDQKVRNEVIYRTTGIHPETVLKDTTLFRDFVEPAFTWSSGEEYDVMRDEYIKQLGQDSPFVSVYLAENLKVDDHNYIDVNNLKSTMSSVDIYPLVERDGTMEYMGVVDYYLYNEADDLVGQGAQSTTTSKAIVKFTVNGEGDGRTVSNIRADAGFASNGTE